MRGWPTWAWRRLGAVVLFEQGLRARGRCCCGTGRMRVCMRPRSGDLRRRVVCVSVCVCVCVW